MRLRFNKPVWWIPFSKQKFLKISKKEHHFHFIFISKFPLNNTLHKICKDYKRTAAITNIPSYERLVVPVVELVFSSEVGVPDEVDVFVEFVVLLLFEVLVEVLLLFVVVVVVVFVGTYVCLYA